MLLLNAFSNKMLWKTPASDKIEQFLPFPEHSLQPPNTPPPPKKKKFWGHFWWPASVLPCNIYGNLRPLSANCQMHAFPEGQCSSLPRFTRFSYFFFNPIFLFRKKKTCRYIYYENNINYLCSHLAIFQLNLSLIRVAIILLKCW